MRKEAYFSRHWRLEDNFLLFRKYRNYATINGFVRWIESFSPRPYDRLIITFRVLAFVEKFAHEVLKLAN